MDVLGSLPAFVLAVLLISASPGPAIALIFRRAALRGMRGAAPTVLGLELGLYVWALFAGLGYAALVAASEVAYLVLRVVGAAVLLWLGFKAWRTAWRERPSMATVGEELPIPGRRKWWGAFGEGVARAGDWFRRPRIRRRVAAVSGTVLVGLGMRVALTSR